MRNQENGVHSNTIAKYYQTNRRSQHPDYRNQINNFTSQQ